MAATANDVLAGGANQDVMTGGDGADDFIFLSAADAGTSAVNRDRVTDFTHADDLDFSKIDAKAGVDGKQAFTFIGNAAFTAAGQIRVVSDGEDKIVYGSTDGDAAAEFQLELDDVAFALVASDFIL